MEGNNTVWESLATRAIRALMARKEVSYARLAAELSALGETESARAVEGRVKRGVFRFTFFLQILSATKAEFPPHWAGILSSTAEWNQRASRVVSQELELRPWLTWLEISRRLDVIGERISPDSLAKQIRRGEFSTTLFLQCAVVCAFDGLDLFLDRSDLAKAAQLGMSRPQTPL